MVLVEKDVYQQSYRQILWILIFGVQSSRSNIGFAHKDKGYSIDMPHRPDRDSRSRRNQYYDLNRSGLDRFIRTLSL